MLILVLLLVPMLIKERRMEMLILIPTRLNEILFSSCFLLKFDDGFVVWIEWNRLQLFQALAWSSKRTGDVFKIFSSIIHLVKHQDKKMQNWAQLNVAWSKSASWILMYDWKGKTQPKHLWTWAWGSGFGCSAQSHYIPESYYDIIVQRHALSSKRDHYFC